MATFDSNETQETTLAAPANQVSAWTVDDIKKSDILVFRDQATEYIDTVVAPNGFQVGLLDENFLTDLLVTGHITGSGVIYAELGFSGSLTKLVDGDDYLVAGSGITLLTQSNGSVLITSTGGGGAGTRIKKEYSDVVVAGTPLEATGIAFADHNYSFDTIDVYLNGELLQSGSSAEVQTADADYYLAQDNVHGQIIFSTNITDTDLVTVTINGGGSGGTSTGGSTYFPGSALELDSETFNVQTDDVTVRTNGANELSVIKTPGQLGSSLGLTNFVFDGSSSTSFSVKPAANTPITVGTSGVGFDLTGQSQALQLQETDELLIWDGTAYKKTSAGEIAQLVQLNTQGAPVDATYLTISNTEDLTNERTLIAGNGLSASDSGANGSYILAVTTDPNGHLEMVSGKLAVNIGSFTGVGLVENEVTGQIDLDYASILGTGLIDNDGKISIDFGTQEGQVASGHNIVRINSGDGIEGGGAFRIGQEESTLTISVKSEDIGGIGTWVGNNNINVNLDGKNGITVLTGSNGELVIDGQSILDQAGGNYIFGEGLQTDSGDPETVSVDFGSGHDQVPRGDVELTVNTGWGLSGGSIFRVSEDKVLDLSLDARGTNGIVVSEDVNGTLVIDGQGIVDQIKDYHFGDGFDVNELVDPQDIQIDWGSGSTQVPRGDNTFTVDTDIGLKGGGVFTIGDSSSIELSVDAEGRNGIQVYSDLDGKLIIDGGSLGSGGGGGGISSNTWDFDEVELYDNNGQLIDTVQATSIGDNIKLKADDGLTLAKDGDQIVIGIDPSTGGLGNGGTGTSLIYGPGPGIQIEDTFIANQKRIQLDYSGSQNVIESAFDGSAISLLGEDTILVRDLSDNLVKEVSLDQVFGLAPSGSSGIVGGVAASGIDQYVYRVADTMLPLTDVAFQDLDTGDVPTAASLSVYLNGDLLLSGSVEDTTAMSTSHPRMPTTTNTHYYVSGTDSISLGVTLVEGDYLVVEKISLVNATNSVSSVLADGGLKQDTTVGDIHVQVNYDGTDTSLIKSAYDGTQDLIDPLEDYVIIHDVSEQKDKYVKLNQLPISGGGGGGGTGAIGVAEDGTYTDGLFTDFVPTTPVGTAVDRFNEVLKILAPPPAPSVKSLNYSVSGGTYNGLLSFDETHPDPAGVFTHVQTYSQLGETGFNATLANEAYSSDSIVYPNSNYDETELHFFRAGVIGKNQSIRGFINFNVQGEVAATGVVQYTNDAFGNADVGTLNLEVNGNVVHSLDLSTFTGAGTAPNGTADDLNQNGSGFTDVSELRSSFTEGGKEFPSFLHRTSEYVVAEDDMQAGFNIARVIHIRGTSTNVTNYVEWVLDNTVDPISFSGDTISVSNQQGSTWISGVQYHESLDLEYSVDIDHAYEAIYSTSPITTTQSKGTSSNVPIDPIGANEDMSKQINFSNTVSVTSATSPVLNEQVDIRITVPHPIKANGVSDYSSSDPLLLYSPSANATQTIEDFTLEEYRLQDSSYNTQPTAQNMGWYDIATVWDPTVSLAGGDIGHNTGLQIYDGKLLAPSNTIDVPRQGDFRNTDDGGVLITHDSNPDYSLEGGAISGTRTYFRYIRNITNFSQRDIIIRYNGSATLVQSTEPLSGNEIKVSVKLPTTPSGNETGWMDANSQFQMFGYNDGDGGYVLPTNGSFDSSVSGFTVNYFTFGKNEVQPDEIIVIKIEADSSWTGNLTDLEVQWGASASGNTQPGALAYTALPLQQVSIDQTGVEAKLSFGPTNPVSGYINVYDPDSGQATDYNQVYNISGYQRGVFNSTMMTGVLNDTLNDRFDRGDLGELKLEVNGTIIQQATVDLTNLGFSGNFIDSDGTGFYNLTAADPSVYQSNGIPSYNNIWRSGLVRVQSASQRDGHNFYRVIHTVNGIDSITNYCEWVNDTNAATFDIDMETMENWTDSNISYQSGIAYYTDPNSIVTYRVRGLYSNVYSTDGQAIGFTSLSNVDLTNNLIQGSGIVTKNTASDSTTLPNLLIGGQSDPVFVTGTLNWNGPNRVLPGTHGTNANTTVSIRPRAHHPIKNSGNYKLGITVSKNNFLIASFSNTSNEYGLETFDSENYRLPDGPYSVDTNITSATWDSTISLVSSNSAYSNGLMQYNGKLVAPSKAGNSGDFTTYHDGGVLQGPAGNPDYSQTISQEDERIYLRAFYNHTTSDYSNLEVDITGVGTLTSENQISNSAGAIGANNRFKMYVKLVEPTSNNKATTGWLDCGEQATGSVADFAGCSTLPLNQLAVNLGSNTNVPIQLPTGRYLYGTTSPLNRNYLLIKIVAHKSWTGNLTKLGVSF